MRLTIGIDDTDSEKGLCTTYLAAVLMERLRDCSEILGRPLLIRLNPCAHFKTRGNAAVAISVFADEPEDVRAVSLQTVLELSDLEGWNTNPGLVVAENVSREMNRFYRRATTEILEIEEALDLLRSEGIWHRGFKKGRGLIGALAAAGACPEDRTFELIAYRDPKRWGTKREIDEASVWEADRISYPGTWDTVDWGLGRVVFAPHSKDPVLFGIRGDSIDSINSAFAAIRSEKPQMTVLYETNQGTDAHIILGRIGELIEDRSYRISGKVVSAPRTIEKGHVFLDLADPIDNVGRLVCAAFEPTKSFRGVVRKLLPGDRIEVWGSIRSGTLNMERLDIVELSSSNGPQAPSCSTCNRRMKSAGKDQGYRCRTCGAKAPGKVESRTKRDIEVGLYEVPPSARRHLSKPLIRFEDPRAHPSR